MTEEQFILIARLLKSRDPVKSAVRKVIFENTTNASAAKIFGASPQSVHRSTKRFTALHADICKVFNK